MGEIPSNGNFSYSIQTDHPTTINITCTNSTNYCSTKTPYFFAEHGVYSYTVSDNELNCMDSVGNLYCDMNHMQVLVTGDNQYLRKLNHLYYKNIVQIIIIIIIITKIILYMYLRTTGPKAAKGFLLI